MYRGAVISFVIAAGPLAGLGFAEPTKTLVPLAFTPLPLSSIKPDGWFRDELETSASGLAGSLGTFYRYVKHSSWLGGKDEYSGLNEGFPYWFNGLVYLAYSLDEDRLKSQVHEAARYVLAHQAMDGWIGPEKGSARLLWGRFPLILGLTGLAEANSSWTQPIVNALYDFTDLMWNMLKDGGRGYVPQQGSPISALDYTWGRVRAADMMISLQWLLEKHPGSKTMQDHIWECLEMLNDNGLKWEDWYNEATYIRTDFWQLSEDIKVRDNPYIHGVNTAQGFKAPAIVYRFSHNTSLIQTAKIGVEWTFKYHGAASGTVLADERLDGLSPYSGSELCTAVEAIYSFASLYQTLGDGSFGDRAELTAFNAAPAMLTGDHWAHQYMEQPNQPFSKHVSNDLFWNSNGWGQTFGLEPNYPCCTVNHIQGASKFLANSWATVNDTGLVHVFLSPSIVDVKLRGNAVKVNCTTEYPFQDTLKYTVNSQAPLDLYVRVPQWCDHKDSSIKVGATPTAKLTPDSSGLHKLRIAEGVTSILYKLSSQTVVTPRANDTVAITRGALLYALEIDFKNSSTLPKHFRTKKEYPADYAPAQVRDWTMINTSPWNFAIDTSTLEFFGSTIPVRKPAFAPGSPTSYMTAMACQIHWPLFKESVPGAAPPKAGRKCLGNPVKVKLVPYGSAKLHMAELATIDLSGSEKGTWKSSVRDLLMRHPFAAFYLYLLVINVICNFYKRKQ